MFEHFGIHEIFSNIKRAIIPIIVIVLIFAIMGAGYVKYKNSQLASDTSAAGNYATSQSYLIVSDKNGEYTGAQKTIQADIDCANTLSAMVKADFCRQYVFDKISKTYSPAEIKKYCNVSISDSNLNFNVLTEVINADVISDTSILNLYSTTGNAEFSTAVTEACVAYLNEEATKSVSSLKKCTFLGGTTVPVNKDDISNISNQNLSMVKYVIIFVLLGFILCLCAILIITLINPCVANKKSFEEYVDKVFSSNGAKGNNGVAYVADSAIKEAISKGYKKVAIVSSSSQNKLSKKSKLLTDELTRVASSYYKDADISFENIKNIHSDFNNFKKLENYDAVILSESAGYTTHIKLANTLSFMAQSNISIVGIALV